MRHPKEEILDLYALGAKTLDSSAVDEVECHLTECRVCRDWVDYLRDFYKTYKETTTERPEAIERSLDSIAPRTPVFELRPFRSSTAKSEQITAVSTVLAANTASTLDTRYRRLAVLASEEEGIVLRVIFDTSTSELHVFLVGGDPARRRFGVVVFPSLGIECLTDETGAGSARIHAPIQDVDWCSQYAQVRLPLEDLAIPNSGIVSHSVGQPARYTVTLQRENTHLKVDTELLRPESPPLTTAALVGPDNQSKLIHFAEGRLTTTLPHPSARFRIRLYI